MGTVIKVLNQQGKMYVSMDNDMYNSHTNKNYNYRYKIEKINSSLVNWANDESLADNSKIGKIVEKINGKIIPNGDVFISMYRDNNGDPVSKFTHESKNKEGLQGKKITKAEVPATTEKNRWTKEKEKEKEDVTTATKKSTRI